MNKLTYEYVSKEVNKLYEKEFAYNDISSIDAHCAFIASFIEACGWTEESYIRAMFGFESLDNYN